MDAKWIRLFPFERSDLRWNNAWLDQDNCDYSSIMIACWSWSFVEYDHLLMISQTVISFCCLFYLLCLQLLLACLSFCVFFTVEYLSPMLVQSRKIPLNSISYGRLFKEFKVVALRHKLLRHALPWSRVKAH